MSTTSKFILANALGTLSDIKFALNKRFVEKRKNDNPLFRMFLDTPLGDELEKKTEEVLAASYYSAIHDKIGDLGGLSKHIGTIIAHNTCVALDRAKLMYQYSKGMISEKKYYYEKSKRSISNAVSFIRMTNSITKPLVKVAAFKVFGKIPLVYVTASKAADYISKGVEKVANQISKNTDKIANKVANTSLAIKEVLIPHRVNVLERVQTLAVSSIQNAKTAMKTLSTAATETFEKVCTKIGAACETVKSGLQKVGSVIKDGGNKVSNFFKRLLS